MLYPTLLIAGLILIGINSRLHSGSRGLVINSCGGISSLQMAIQVGAWMIGVLGDTLPYSEVGLVVSVLFGVIFFADHLAWGGGQEKPSQLP